MTGRAERVIILLVGGGCVSAPWWESTRALRLQGAEIGWGEMELAGLLRARAECRDPAARSLTLREHYWKLHGFMESVGRVRDA